MGAQALVFFGALSLSVGLYGFGIKEAARMVHIRAEQHAYRAQAELIAKSGLELAVNKLGWEKPPRASDVAGVALLDEGSLGYTADDDGLPKKHIRVTSIGTYYGYDATTVAVVECIGSTKTGIKGKGQKKWFSWETTSISTTVKESYSSGLPTR
ncbi:MAG: hypothetical protein ACE5H0_06580 [Bacteroidota bacterium]